MSKYFKYIWLVLLWVLVAAYVIYAGGRARTIHSEKMVGDVRVNLLDSTSHGHLVSAAKVKRWLRGKVPTVGVAVDSVDLGAIESVVAENGFVEWVHAYIGFNGDIEIDIKQREPVLRFLVDGFNSYVTADGYIFTAPSLFSLYVPVVTGGYRPPFPSSYSGFVGEWIEGEIAVLDDKIEAMEVEKYPFYERDIVNDDSVKVVNRMFIKRDMFERKTDFENRVSKLRRHKAWLRKKYRYENVLIGQGIAKVEKKREIEREKQKKLGENYEDFLKLINFVKFIDEDDFWRSEIVQINVEKTASGEMELSFVPRSSSCTIVFGSMDDYEVKFEKLINFYERGFGRMGWSRYKVIDVKYRDLVVCKRYKK